MLEWKDRGGPEVKTKPGWVENSKSVQELKASDKWVN